MASWHPVHCPTQPFHLACENGHDEVVAILLGKLNGPNVKRSQASQLRRGSALFLAEKHNHQAVILMLQRAEEDVASSEADGTGSASVHDSNP